MAYRIFERETDDWAEVPIIQDGATFTGSWSYQIVQFGDTYRPTGSWLPSVTNASKKGVDIQGMAKGLYSVWVRIDGLAGYAPIFRNTDVLVIK
jgi:hypothetical protein